MTDAKRLTQKLEPLVNGNAPLTLIRAAHLKYKRWHENGGQGARHGKRVADKLAELIRAIEADEI